MAKEQKRVWLSRGPSGHKVRKVAWGYTLQVHGKPERCFRAARTREIAQAELAARLLKRDTPPPEAVAAMTFGAAIARYLEVKKMKRGWKDDQRNPVRLRNAFGADRALSKITAGRIAEYKLERARTLVRRDGEKRPISAATLNRELAVLRHLFTLAVEEWEVLDKAPHIRLEKEPEGRIAWLEAKEEAALLAACRASQNKQLASLVTIALESGLR
jgi:hypothetical protein